MIHLQTMRSFSLLLLLLLPLAAGVQAAAPPPAPAPPAPPPAAPAGPPAAGSILAPPDWSTELVDSTRTTGKYASLALDAAGHPHVSYSYYYNNDYDLRYAYHDGTDWITTTVDSTGNVGAYSSLALDAAGHPHISYRDSGNFDLKYAYHDGTNWISMTVDSTGTVGLYTSIALDDAGHPHISYRDNTHTCLKYAYHDGSAWHLVQNPVPNAGLYTSIALDAAGHPHISHVDGNASLHYTYYDGTWHDDNPVEDNVQYHTSLALDSTGAPHISYYDSANADLGYATFVGAGGTCMNTAWQCDTIDETADVGRYSSLALDSLDRPRISYCEYLSGPAACDKLKYAYYVGAGGGMDCTDSDWTCQTVDGIDPLIPAGAYSSLALGRDNRPHIAYFVAGADNDLYYAYDRNCLPLSGVELTGPTFLLVNQTGAYTASESPPPTATLPLAFSWQDGATGPTAAYSWTQPGLYTVAATLSNPCSTVTHALTVTVCQPVNSGAITGPAFLLTNQSAAYTLTYGPANASLPVSYLWDNGSTGPSAVYSWTLPGTYTLTVTIANPCGQVQASYVVQVCQPVNSALIDGPAFLLTGQSAAYTLTAGPDNASSPLSYLWDNGTTGPSAVYSWTLPGTHTIAATVTNPCGQVQAGYDVQVCQPVNGGIITGPAHLVTGQEGTYNASYGPPNASAPISYFWDNGAVGPNTVYSWTDPGSYTITVTIANPCGQVQASYGVQVCQPVNSAAIDGPAFLLTGQSAAYTLTAGPGNASSPLSYLWDNGAVGPSAVYSWTEPGAHIIVATVTNPCGQVQAGYGVQVCQPVNSAAIDGPAFLLTNQSAAYTLTAGPDNASSPLSYLWDNGTTGPSTVYAWAEPGLYSIAATVTNPCGQVQAGYGVEVCQPVVSAAIDGPATLLVGENGAYNASYEPADANLPVNFTWDNSSSGPSAVYSWTTPGVYTITVSVDNPCGLVQGQRTVLVSARLYQQVLPVIHKPWFVQPVGWYHLPEQP